MQDQIFLHWEETKCFQWHIRSSMIRSVINHWEIINWLKVMRLLRPTTNIILMEIEVALARTTLSLHWLVARLIISIFRLSSLRRMLICWPPKDKVVAKPLGNGIRVSIADKFGGQMPARLACQWMLLSPERARFGSPVIQQHLLWLHSLSARKKLNQLGFDPEGIGGVGVLVVFMPVQRYSAAPGPTVHTDGYFAMHSSLHE